MNACDRNGPGISGSGLERWMQKSDDSAITKMQHQYWVTKQTLSRKLGKKEDECIVASDAELDAKLELFRSIQESCSFLQRVIDKYQERLCNLAQEENAMGRFLKEASKQDKTRAGKMMSAVGKSLSYSGQQRLTLRSPLVRLYQEVETFRQRAIEDTLQNVQAMEKARTEYRAALSWMKNISQELDPDTSRQLARFRKVQWRVRRDKSSFDTLALDCLQKVDLLAAARCNMFSHALVLYQSTLLSFTKKSAQAYSTIASSFKGHQPYDFLVVRELAETSSKLAQETGGDEELDDKDKLLFFESEYHDSVEEAAEAKPEKDDKLLDLETENALGLDGLGNLSNREIASAAKLENDIEKFFESLSCKDPADRSRLEDRSLADLDLAMDCFRTDALISLSTNEPSRGQQLLDGLDSSSSLLDATTANEWDNTDTFLPLGILKQSLGDAARGIPPRNDDNKKKNKGNKQKGSSWLDLFAELDPLANNSVENLMSGTNAPA